MNAIGLDNVGVEVFESDKFFYLRSIDCVVIVNYFVEFVEVYVELAVKLGFMEGVDVLEANISCFNVKVGGLSIWCGSRGCCCCDVGVSSCYGLFVDCEVVVRCQ